jgi:hypothetical protein
MRLAASMSNMDLTAPRASILERSTFEPLSNNARDTASGRLWFGWRKTVIVVTMAMLVVTGVFLRLHPTATFAQLGFDEYRYVVLLKQIGRAGLLNYDAVVRVYVERQYQRGEAVVPATRIGFLAPAYICGQLLRQSPFNALRTTAGIASSLLLCIAAIFAYRMGGPIPMLGMTLLVATAPLQIQLAQHTFIDAYFSFWAVAVLWLMWENLQRPRHWGWLTTYTLCLVMLVLTKESAAFVVVAILGVFAFNRAIRLGTVTTQLIAATIIGPLLAVLFLSLMIGSISEFIRFFEMFMAKQRTNPYSIMAQDGAWYRYIVDFVLMSPLIVLLAFGRMFNLRKTDRPELMMTVFLAASFLCMANVSYGMSLRYAAYWDIPLLWLACSQILRLSGQFRRVRPAVIAGGLFLVMAACGLRQYDRYFVEGSIYDPITAWLVRASNLEK